MRGKIIVFEGMDGTGKNTQSKLLYEKIRQYNPRVIHLSFPNYHMPIGNIIKEYLNGEIYSDRQSVDDMIGASTLYALDRHQTFYLTGREFCDETHGRLIDFYNDGYTIICDRYTSSNQLYMSANLLNDDIDKKFLLGARLLCSHIQSLEYSSLKIPIPDAVVLLRMHPQLSEQLLLKRYEGDTTKCDKNENIEFQNKVYKTIGVFSELSDNNIIVIDCDEDGKILDIPEIQSLIMSKLGSVLL